MIDAELTVGEDFPPVTWQAWRDTVARDLKGADFDKRLVKRLYEGLTLGPLDTAEQSQPRAPSGGWRAQPRWELRQAYAAPDPADAAAAIREDLAAGATSVLLTFAAATRRAEAIAEGAAADGLLAATAADLAAALDGVDLAAVPVHLDAGAAAPLLAAQLVALAEARGVARGALRGGFGLDPLGTLARDGRLPQGRERALGELGSLGAWTHEQLPGVRAVTVDSGAWHRAGCAADQELAWAMATGVAYLRALTAAGLDIDAAAGQIAFSLRVGGRFALCVAKLRAARLLWARILGACGASEGARAMSLHARTAERELTRRDPHNNILRATAGAFAAAVGGADAVTTAPFDAALGAPDAQARRLARNTQLILAEESHLHRVQDPGAGSWTVERLTRELADEAWTRFQDVEREGGMVTALESGRVAAAVAQVAARRREALAKRKDPITGVSEFPNLAQPPVIRDPADVAALVAAGVARRAGWDPCAALEALAAAGPRDFEARVAAARAGASNVELADALWSDAAATKLPPLPAWRLADGYEALRDRSDRRLAATGARPRIFLANLGPIAQHTARATWIRSVFEAGGIEALTNDGFPDGAAAAAAFGGSGATAAVICSSDALYTDHAADAARALKAAGAERVYLAGRPGAAEADYRQAGVDTFVFVGCDVLALNAAELAAQGVPQ